MTSDDVCGQVEQAPSSEVQVAHATSRHLHGLIKAGKWPIGEALPPQRDLAKTLKVSRSSLREALSILEAFGVLRTIPRQGTIVADTEGTEAHGSQPKSGKGYEQSEIYQFRFMIEGYGARIAATRATQSQIDEMAANIAASRSAVRDEDLVSYVQCDFEFHRMILTCSGSQLLLDLYDQFGATFRENLRLPLASHRRLSEPLNEHENIFRAIERHSAEDAAYFMHLHVMKAANRAEIPFNEVI
ncbi:FadR family transcriptional regulator [Acidisoma cellulosilytica]|uniref:FadR family transcriptional regulator n=1 Tax=Acidisoma cellulosilyticum TaxID=2802395 RepID=A0A963Z6V2_9PROT|nr:FCD domain-containing protein [Acidisoma cellulosilyticum]MCB8883175.1 FadR family transcriptional regulator [Acidisoma cellulosilyticum]